MISVRGIRIFIIFWAFFVVCPSSCPYRILINCVSRILLVMLLLFISLLGCLSWNRGRFGQWREVYHRGCPLSYQSYQLIVLLHYHRVSDRRWVLGYLVELAPKPLSHWYLSHLFLSVSFFSYQPSSFFLPSKVLFSDALWIVLSFICHLDQNNHLPIIHWSY